MKFLKRFWPAWCPALVWGLSLVTEGAKTPAPFLLVEMLLLAGVGVWIVRGGTLLREPWQGQLAALGVWGAVQFLSPGSVQETLTHLAWLGSLAAFFCLARYAWGPRQKDLFLSSVIGAGLMNILFVFVQFGRGFPTMGLFSGNPNYSASLTAAAPRFFFGSVVAGMGWAIRCQAVG